MVLKRNYFVTMVLFIISYKFIRECLSDKSGTYHINFERVEECKDFSANQSKAIWSAKYFRYNRTHRAGNGSLEIFVPVGKETSVNAHFFKWGDGGWKRNFLVVKKNNLCRSLHIYFNKFVVSILTTIGVKEPHKCPIPPGKYGAYNVHVPFYLIDTPFFYGRFKLVTNAFYLNERAACITFYGELTEVIQY